MLTTQSPATGAASHQIEARRTPLQPKNLPSITNTACTRPNNPGVAVHHKENMYMCPSLQKGGSFPMESFDVSLAQELSAVRERLDRVRADRDKNEKLLRERGLMLDLHFKDIVDRGEAQKRLEMEVDRLHRLREIRLACTRISQVRSLREKEQEKRLMKQHILPMLKTQNTIR